MTLDRGRKFKKERYITSDNILIKFDKGIFCVKGLGKVSMKKEKRSVAVKLSTMTSKVLDGSCSCPARKSGYCNRMMALLLKLADYSLSQFESVSKEIHAKSTSNGNYCSKTTKCKGIASTLYDPRKVDDRAINWEKVNILKE